MYERSDQNWNKVGRHKSKIVLVRLSCVKKVMVHVFAIKNKIQFHDTGFQ